MGGFRLESPIKAIKDLPFDRFPTKAMKGVHIVRQDNILLGKAERGYLIYTTFGYRHGGRYSRYFLDLSAQCREYGYIKTLLKGLKKLGLITEDDIETHMGAIDREQEKRDFKVLCRELVGFTKNDEILQKIAHHTDENLESLLTSDDAEERKFAKAVVRLREALT